MQSIITMKQFVRVPTGKRCHAQRQMIYSQRDSPQDRSGVEKNESNLGLGAEKLTIHKPKKTWRTWLPRCGRRASWTASQQERINVLWLTGSLTGRAPGRWYSELTVLSLSLQSPAGASHCPNPTELRGPTAWSLSSASPGMVGTETWQMGLEKQREDSPHIAYLKILNSCAQGVFPQVVTDLPESKGKFGTSFDNCIYIQSRGRKLGQWRVVRQLPLLSQITDSFPCGPQASPENKCGHRNSGSKKAEHRIVLLVSQSCPRFATPWTIAHQAPLSIRCPRQEYWSGLPFLSPRDLPDPGIKTGCPALQADSLPSEPPGKPRQKTTELRVQITIVPCLPKRTTERGRVISCRGCTKGHRERKV